MRQQLEPARMNATASNVSPFGPQPKRQTPVTRYDDAE